MQRYLLNDDELRLLADSGLHMVRHSLHQKLLGQMHQARQMLENRGISAALQPFLPPGAQWRSPKVSHGQNMGNLPWMALDCPAWFAKDEWLALRLLVWHGRYIGLYLLAAGRPAAGLSKKPLPGHWLIGNGPDYWNLDIYTQFGPKPAVLPVSDSLRLGRAWPLGTSLADVVEEGWGGVL